MVLKNGCVMISMKPESRLQPNLSTGFLFKKPLRMEAALTLRDRGIRMVFSRITGKRKSFFSKFPTYESALLPIENSQWNLAFSQFNNDIDISPLFSGKKIIRKCLHKVY